MACTTHCCVLTRGEFFISDWHSSCLGGLSEIVCQSQPSAFKKLGNVSSCVVEVSSQVLGKENKFNPLTDACARTMIEGVNITLTLNCASRDNLYQALFAEKKTEEDSGTHILDYCMTSLSECDFFPFQKKQALETGLQVIVRDAMGTVVKTLVKDTDYIWSRSGVEIIRDDIDIEDGAFLRLVYDYDTTGYYDMKFQSKFMGYKSLYFKGSNFDGGGDAMFDAIFNKVLFGPVSQFDLITRDEFLTLTLSGSVELDADTWFNITKQES